MLAASKTRAVMAFGAGLFALALSAPATAQPGRCFESGDVVVFDGIATPAENRSQWVLRLAHPICAGKKKISAIRIIGTPPPLGIPLELTGKLMLGRGASESAMFVALVVSRGRKLHAIPPVAAPARNEAAQGAGDRCSAPPYGGTKSDYQAFVRHFADIIKPEKILSGICNAKFGNAPRNGLHKLGFTDARIDSESTEHLAGETIAALKHLVNTIE